MERAISQGYIVWNAVPYTVESGTMSADLFRTCLQLSARLDRRFGKTTRTAKMTDVPGHTRSIVTPLHDAGIRLLHVGVNPASPIPEVPDFCRWHDVNGKEIILVYQRDYGTESLLPDGKTVVSIHFTGDGDEVVQLYVQRQKDGNTTIPNCALKGFRRVHLKRGETKMWCLN